MRRTVKAWMHVGPTGPVFHNGYMGTTILESRFPGSCSRLKPVTIVYNDGKPRRARRVECVPVARKGGKRG